MASGVWCVEQDCDQRPQKVILGSHPSMARGYPPSIRPLAALTGQSILSVRCRARRGQVCGQGAGWYVVAVPVAPDYYSPHTAQCAGTARAYTPCKLPPRVYRPHTSCCCMHSGIARVSCESRLECCLRVLARIATQIAMPECH